MRLLHFDQLERLVLTDFRGKTIPPYAILSHRWSDSEILLEDIASGVYKDRQDGYQKLEFCAKQATQDNLQFFWIDTCCIDRWDLHERSKSINSMFQWYKNATRCYVFLSDVSLPTATESSQRSKWEALFRASAWFTRGWTLQELIAPVSVQFFTIPLEALRNCPPDHFNMSERQRWAENRTTTEEEDIIYCLLGILGISMPTAYGEGKESARSRLQAEVEAADNVPSIIPFSRNPGLVGREAQLAKLEAELFSNEHTTTTLAIVGPGGTGKSQLALEVAHRIRQNSKHCSVFWIDASDKDGLYQSYASVAQKLSIADWDDDQPDIKRMMQQCVAELSARQCLLIFDNAEDTVLRSSSSSTAKAGDLADYLPQSTLCSIVFTTTNSDTAKTLASNNIIALRELTPNTALMVLQNRLANPLSDTRQLREAELLLRELSYLPLAVVQAAACINASGMAVQEYRAQLDEHKEAAFERISSLGSNLYGHSTDDPVAATLFVSMGHVYKNVLAVDYLFLAACVERKDVPLDLFEAASSSVREDAFMVLDKYALVSRRPADSSLDIHRLVHRALRNGDEQDEARSRPSFHADQHGQSGIDIQEPRPMGGGGEATGAGDGDEQDEARNGPSRHAE
ncbi:HET-domain-containing protein [Paraphaeosphaeria sporulosa]|uniref:HET-domain-containing protein n=1 Tax=Paraphaeosphaeria sporulosa TaxID=1460663 RepID=A0A177BZD1_9PLEO|nr:HET-domain-containing protein [Paraphaeosphaeria sporulosa]OAF99941.1 HET-domain-containing protein [Paraphaeosphaeria sporulosa]